MQKKTITTVLSTNFCQITAVPIHSTDNVQLLKATLFSLQAELRIVLALETVSKRNVKHACKLQIISFVIWRGI